MKRILLYLTITILSFTFYNASATHLAGQDFTYKLVDSVDGVYHYLVSLSIYQDCLNGQPGQIILDNPAYLAIYNGLGSLISSDSVYYSYSDTMTISAISPCSSASVSVCSWKKTFTKDYYLTTSASGYIIVYQRCCLNFPINLVDPGDHGMTATCSIPPYGITLYNNSAVFTNYPPFIIGIDEPIAFDFSATDADGDSLSYELCSAYDYSGSYMDIKPYPPSPPPFVPLTYIPGLSYSNPMNCSVPISIDPATGLLIGTPNVTGTYLLSVCCNEWRSGVLINTVQREFEFTVATCPLGVPILSKGEKLGVYPNPTATELTITCSDKLTSIAITNLLGQAVYSNHYNNSPQAQVDVSNLPSGIYFVKVNGTDVREFVKE